MTNPADTIIIGVDGGGSGCRVLLGTAAAGPLGSATGGPANFTSDPIGAIATIIASVQNAAKDAGIPNEALAGAVAHVGVAGAMTASDSARVAAALPYGDVVVTDDRPTAVIGALGKHDGYLLAVGTGTITAASVNGALKFVGGWGFQLSDHASGAWLGRMTLEQILLCHDGLAGHTPLTHKVFATFDHDPTAIVTFANRAKPADYAALAPDIVAQAASGDPWAQEIMAKGAKYLTSALSKLGFQSGDPLCLSGGIGPFYADFFSAGVIQARVNPKGSAVDGAFQLAQAQTKTVT